MAASQKKPDRAYTYGEWDVTRLAVLAAFTNATAVSFVCVILLNWEALHAFIQDESEHNSMRQTPHFASWT